jgi:hypothetical protein
VDELSRIRRPFAVCFEASTGYGALYERLQPLARRVVVAHPGHLRLILYWNDAGGTDAGRAYLYECNRYFVLSPNGGDTWNVGGGETIAWLGAEPADLLLSVNGGNSYSRLKTGMGGSGSNTVALTVPHQPTRFAKVRVIPADASVGGMGESDSLFTIEANITLLSLKAQPGGAGVVLSWSTEPTVGPEGLAGYRVYRLGRDETGNGVRIGPSLISETTYTDTQGLPGHSYRLVGVNGLQEELELGRITVRSSGSLEIQFANPLGAAGLPSQLQARWRSPP